MASALPSIKPSIDVKYLTSLAPGAAFGESFIWAKARSGEAVTRPIRQNRNERIGDSSKDRSGDTARLFRFSCESGPSLSKPLHNSLQKKPPRNRPCPLHNVAGSPLSQAHPPHPPPTP